MGFHKPLDESDILRDDKLEFQKTLSIVQDFSKYISDKYVELREFSPKYLADNGISLEQGETITIRLASAKLCISFENRNGYVSFGAQWFAKNPLYDFLRQTEDERTREYFRTMDFDTRITKVGDKPSSMTFSFGSDEARNANDVEHYIDGYSLEPGIEIAYDKDYGRYNPTHILQKGKINSTYSPINGWLRPFLANDIALTEPQQTAVTSCESFDAARSEMILKIEAFKNKLDSILEKLKNRSDKGIQMEKKND